MVRKIESLWIAGPAGRMEALLEAPDNGPPVEAAVVCHPHPLFGGTLHNKVVHRMARALRSLGSVVLRFNFRGVNRSQGEHSHGIGEVEDARAAQDWLRATYPGLPCCLAGFSFGAGVALRLGCSDAAVARMIAAGFPAIYYQSIDLTTCGVDKTFIHSTNDEHGPVEDLERYLETVAEPKRLIRIPAGNHFFAGGLDRLEEEIRNLPR